MTRKGGWIACGVLLLALLMVAVTSVTAQRPPFPMMPRLPMSEVGRYEVVKTTDTEILLVDSTTGDLYRATMSDVKPYSKRPKPKADEGMGMPFPPKDAPFPSKEK